MKIKPNFHSVVILGGFNPSILTPTFLKQFCDFKTEQNPTGHTTAVMTEIKYGNLLFQMELNCTERDLI